MKDILSIDAELNNFFGDKSVPLFSDEELRMANSDIIEFCAELFEDEGRAYSEIRHKRIYC